MTDCNSNRPKKRKRKKPVDLALRRGGNRGGGNDGRKNEDVFRSTLDDEVFQCSISDGQYGVEDGYRDRHTHCRNGSNCYDDEDDYDDDVLVEDDDDVSFDDDDDNDANSNSDGGEGSSCGSPTSDQRDIFKEKEKEAATFDTNSPTLKTTKPSGVIPNQQPVLTFAINTHQKNGPVLKPEPYSQAIKRCSAREERDNNDEHFEIRATPSKISPVGKIPGVTKELVAVTVPVPVTSHPVTSTVIFKAPTSSYENEKTVTMVPVSLINSVGPSVQPHQIHSLTRESVSNDDTNADSDELCQKKLLKFTDNGSSYRKDKLYPSHCGHEYEPQGQSNQVNDSTMNEKTVEGSRLYKTNKAHDSLSMQNQKYASSDSDQHSNLARHQIQTAPPHIQPSNKTISFINSSTPTTHSPYPLIPTESESTTVLDIMPPPPHPLEHHNCQPRHVTTVSIEPENLELNTVRDRDRDSGIFSAKRDCEGNGGECIHLKTMGSSEVSLDHISEQSCSLQDLQVKRVVEELNRDDVSKAADFRFIIYIIALSFHGIFEGIALGLQSMKSSVWALCFAIVVHRCVLAFKLGMDLCRGEEKQGTSFLCIGMFTLISTLGIIIGILISSGASLYSDVSVPEAILQSLATGTIFYIVFLDILFKDLQGKDDLKRVSCFFVGFSLMAIVFAVTRS